MHDLTASSDTIEPAISGERLFHARDRLAVRIAWRFSTEFAGVRISVNDSQGDLSPPFDLGMDDPLPPRRILVLGPIEITLWLERGDAGGQPGICLYCRVPLTQAEMFDGVIGAWYDVPGPNPEPDPDPFSPDGDEAGVAAIRLGAPPATLDLFPFVWMQAPGRAGRRDDAALRFARCAASATLDLYKQLAACAGPGAADKKRAIAGPFLTGAASIKEATLASQLPLTAPFAALRRALVALPGELPLSEIDEIVEFHLAQPAAIFLMSTEWQQESAAVWQTLYALALAGAAADAQLAQALQAVAQIEHWLTLLAARTEALTAPAPRRLALDATLVLPDAVAALAPAPDLSGPSVQGKEGRWQVLGVGTLKMARQRLHAYLPGELAEVVNVMPRERQEVKERSLSHAAQHGDEARDQFELASEQQNSSASSDLSDAMHAVMAADGLMRNMNDVKPSYGNLDLTLSGSAAGGDARSGWSGNNTAQLARRVTEKAATQMSQRVGTQRKKIWQQLQERRQSNLIDNAGHGRLVGIYRWIDRVMRVHMEPLGERLVLSFLIDQPAGDWLARLKAGSGIAPEAPVAPLDFGQAHGYAQITPANYQDFGAFYGLNDLAPPPAQMLQVCLSVDRVGAAGGAALNIPEGYIGQSATVVVALEDDRYHSVCAIGAMQVITPATGKALILSATVPQSAAPASALAAKADAFAAAVDVPLPQRPAMHTSVHAAPSDGWSGALPVTVMTGAPAFAVNITLQCELDAAVDSAGARILRAWQIAVFQRLLEADRQARSAYADALTARIASASAGREGEIQRGALQQRCLDLLAPAAQDWRSLAPMLDWASMTWQYEQWPVTAHGAWPEAGPPGVTDPGSDRLFQQFLAAPAVRVLLPACALREAWVLYWLQFQQPWPGAAGTTPLTESCVPLQEQLLHPDPAPARTPPWTVRVPTSMLYLQHDAGLPSFAGPERGPAPAPIAGRLA